MLRLRELEARLEIGEQQPLEDLDCGGKERDGTIGGGLGVGFAGLGDCDDSGSAPDGRDVCMGDGEVEDEGQVADSCGS